MTLRQPVSFILCEVTDRFEVTVDYAILVQVDQAKRGFIELDLSLSIRRGLVNVSSHQLTSICIRCAPQVFHGVPVLFIRAHHERRISNGTSPKELQDVGMPKPLPHVDFPLDRLRIHMKSAFLAETT